ncbi:type II secretion system F family protein [Paenibacillus sp.]|uniref:type II secretion system F family protein n=1 Tax=Paenibacillus sp. TaxID=58172 RepID=UPI002D400B48|nr:type II secretion system F family protein [Paenibacillus sp.]HZG58589.1 type II secretion system F family protein [Paenibacillus sp.]
MTFVFGATVLLFSLTAFFLFLFLFQSVLLSDRRLQKRMKAYLQTASDAKKPLDRRRFDLFVRLQSYKRAVRERVLTKQNNARLERALLRAGLPLRPEEFVMFHWIIAALTAGLGAALLSHWVFAVIGGALGYALPPWWLRKKQGDRLRAFNDELPDMLSTMIGSLRAGFSLAQSLKTVVDEMDEPIRSEMDTVLKEMQYGHSMETAFQSLKERMPSEDLELMIQAILIQKQVGGNLAVILETIVGTIRDRNKIQRQLKTLTAQGKLSGLVIGSLPFGLGVLIYLMEPKHIETLFHHPVGIALLAAGFLSGTIGFVLIRKVTTIEV